MPHRKVYAWLKQMRWLLWRMISLERCCFCGEKLFDGTDQQTFNNITLHHVEGDKQGDDYSEPAQCDLLLLAHSECHRRYHAYELALKKAPDELRQRVFDDMHGRMIREQRRVRERM